MCLRVGEGQPRSPTLAHQSSPLCPTLPLDGGWVVGELGKRLCRNAELVVFERPYAYSRGVWGKIGVRCAGGCSTSKFAYEMRE